MKVNVEVVSQVSWEPNKSVSIRIPAQGKYVSGPDRSFRTNTSISLIRPQNMNMYVKNDNVEFYISAIILLQCKN